MAALSKKPCRHKALRRGKSRRRDVARCYEEEGAAEKNVAVKRSEKEKNPGRRAKARRTRRRALQKRSKAQQRGPVAPHPHLAAKERLQGRKLMAKDGQQVRFASDDGYVHRRIGCKGRKYAAAQGKGTRKAGIRRKDGIAAGYARQRVRMTGQRGAYRRPSGRAGFGRRRPPGTERGDPAVDPPCSPAAPPFVLEAGCAQRARRPSETFRSFAIGRGGSHARLARRRRKRSGRPFPDKDLPVSGVVCRHVPGRDEAGANGMGKAAERMAALWRVATKEKEFPFWPNHTMQILAVLQRT